MKESNFYPGDLIGQVKLERKVGSKRWLVRCTKCGSEWHTTADGIRGMKRRLGVREPCVNCYRKEVENGHR